MKLGGSVRGGFDGMVIFVAAARLGMAETVRGGPPHEAAGLLTGLVCETTPLRSVAGGEGLRMSTRDCFHRVELAGRMVVGSMNTGPNQQSCPITRNTPANALLRTVSHVVARQVDCLLPSL